MHKSGNYPKHDRWKLKYTELFIALQYISVMSYIFHAACVARKVQVDKCINDTSVRKCTFNSPMWKHKQIIEKAFSSI